MALINGTSFGLFHDGNILGHSTQTKFSLSVDLPESTTKESAGFKQVIAGVRSGTISVSGLTDYSDTLNFDILLNVEETAESETAVTFDVEIQLTGLFSIQQEGADRYWNTTDVLWENANFEWQVA
jgi:hypothetical protein